MLEESLMQAKCPLCTFFTALPLGLLIQSIFGEIEKWNKEYKEIMYNSQHGCGRWAPQPHLTPPCSDFACGGLRGRRTNARTKYKGFFRKLGHIDGRTDGQTEVVPT